MMKRIAALVLLLFVVAGSPARSDDKLDAEQERLRKQVQNPVANLVSFPLQNNTLWEFGPLEKTQNILNVQPVFPFSLNEDWNLISRTILPVISQPEFVVGQGRTDGIGDVSESLFLSPAKPGKWIWGVGPVVLLPTATDKRLGSDGSWSLGPSVLALTMPGKWVVGGLVSNAWDVAGSGDDVNFFTFQAIANYNMEHGWYLTSTPIITANWEASSGQKWTVPLGGGVGRVFRIGAPPFNVQGQVFYNVDAPDTVGDWSLRVQLQMMFPKKPKQ